MSVSTRRNAFRTRIFAGAVGSIASVACAADNPYGSGLVVLDPQASGALTMSGQSRVVVPANAVYVNSSSRDAVRTSGQCIIDTPRLYICGDPSGNTAAHCTGQTFFSASAFADPLSHVSFPTGAGMTNHGNKSVSSHQVVTLSPGRYGNITISGEPQVTFQPGIYVISGDMSVSGQARIVGSNVTLVFTSKSLSISGGALIEFSPSAEGSMAGVVFAQPPSNTSAMSLSGGSAINISGTIYLPGAEIKLSGQGTAEGEGPQIADLVIAKKATLSGQGLIKIGKATDTAIVLPKMPLFD